MKYSAAFIVLMTLTTMANAKRVQNKKVISKTLSVDQQSGYDHKDTANLDISMGKVDDRQKAENQIPQFNNAAWQTAVGKHNEMSMSPREQQIRRVVEDVVGALGLADKAIAESPNPHRPHNGKDSDFLVAYGIRNTEHAGMGVIVTQPVRKGQQIWRFNKTNVVPFYKEDVPILQKLLRTREPEVGVWLSHWTYSWPGYCGKVECVLFELGDNRFLNDEDSPGDNVVSDAAGNQFAKTDIPANTELRVDYDLDMDTQPPAWWRAFTDSLGD